MDARNAQDDRIAEQRVAVNTLVAQNPGAPVLVHWIDLIERSDIGSRGLKNKYPDEVECLAIGKLTGAPIRRALGQSTHEMDLTGRCVSQSSHRLAGDPMGARPRVPAEH